MGTGFFDPLFWCEREAVEACFFSKPVEFDGIKIRVVELFSDPQKFDCVTVTDPAADKIVSMVWILIPCNIGDTDVVLIVVHHNGNFTVKDIDLCHHPLSSYGLLWQNLS